MVKKQSVVKDVLKNIGLLDEGKIKEALAEQAKTGARFSGILVKLGQPPVRIVARVFIPSVHAQSRHVEELDGHRDSILAA